MTKPVLKNVDLFGGRGSFYGKPYQGDYYQDDQRQEMADMLEMAGFSAEADRYRGCRKSFILTECKDRCGNHKDNIDRMFISPVSCHARYCETCARIYARTWRKKALPYIKSLASGSKRRRFKHIIFEFKNPDNVTSRFISSRMKIIGKLIRKYCSPRAKKSNKFIGGAVGVLEMSPGGYFHVHVLAYCYYIDQKAMSADFLDWTGDSYRIWVSDGTRGQGRDIKKAERVLNEVTKYITKPVVTPFVDELFDYAMAIKGRRRIHAWGLFYNNKWIKAEISRSQCPYCGGLLKFLGEDARYDDGNILPAWFIRDYPDRARALDRYG